MPSLSTNNKRAYFRGSGGRFLGSKGRLEGTLIDGIGNFYFKTREVMEEKALEFSEELLDYAKQNAPWADRSGQARAELDTAVEADDGLLNLTLFHGVDYGIWLEIRWNGRYAIILPSLEAKGSELLQRWEGILDRTVYY